MQPSILLLLLSHLVTSYGSDALLRVVVTTQYEKPKFSAPVALRLSEDDFLAFGSVVFTSHVCVTTYAGETMLGFSVTKVETTHALLFASEDGGCSWETVIDAVTETQESETRPRAKLYAFYKVEPEYEKHYWFWYDEPEPEEIQPEEPRKV